MNSIFKIFILLLPFGLIAQTNPTINPNGYNTFYYDNGKISSEGTLHNGKPDGYWKTYYQSGILKSEGGRKNFQLDSVWKFYNEQGMLTSELHYKAGKKNGLKKTYDNKEGYLTLSENYENDIKQGNTIEYHVPLLPTIKLGKTKKIAPYVNGLEEGQGFEYTPDSTLITITQYKMGYIQKEERFNRTDRDGLKQGIWKEFYPTGTVKKETNYLNDKIDGYVKEYSITDNLIKSSKYINGVEQTDVPELAKPEFKTELYKNGVVKREGAFINGKAEGTHKEYSPEGELTKTLVYSKGVVVAEGVVDSLDNKQGFWKEYYATGNLRAVGDYLHNKRVGDWTFYYENGKIEQVGKYDNKGKAQGIWKWYYPCYTPCFKDTGKIKAIENYVNNLLEGDYIEYNDSGRVTTKGKYFNNKKEGFWTLEYYEYKEEGKYIEGNRDGEWRHYYVSNGKLRFKGSFVDDEPDGPQVFYYQNGNKRQEGSYAGGLQEGEWNYYDENGILILTITFKSGVGIRYDGVKSPEAY